MKQVTPQQIYHRWLDALRSGEYEQCDGQLRYCEYTFDESTDEPIVLKVNGFCCLGVLEDLAVKDGGPAWGTLGGASDDDAEPRREIQQFLGLDAAMVAHLIDMNDEQGASFEEIADEIEFNIMPCLDYK